MKDKYRKIALTIALGFIFLCCKAQKQVPIEPAMMEVSYHIIGNNTDNYALRIGKNVTSSSATTSCAVTRWAVILNCDGNPQ